MIQKVSVISVCFCSGLSVVSSYIEWLCKNKNNGLDFTAPATSRIAFRLMYWSSSVEPLPLLLDIIPLIKFVKFSQK